MNKIVQIGSGMIGSAMAYDLSQKHDVIVGDFNEESLAKVKKLNQTFLYKSLMSQINLS
tara:strand:+ start:267 stop:443 length:177 start_codon:yes stop_codon:yes gene_type:complete